MLVLHFETVVPVPHGVQIEAIQLSHRSRGHELNHQPFLPVCWPRWAASDPH